MLMTGRLERHLAEIDRTAQERVERIMDRLAKSFPPPDRADDPLGWAAYMNGLAVMAECAFLDHGEIKFSNNQAENAIQPVVVGRKSWLFCDTQAGANASAVVFTMLETARANGLDSEAWLNPHIGCPAGLLHSESRGGD